MNGVSPTRRRLGAALRALRVRGGVSQTALGEAVGWTQTRVSKLERGTQLPSPEDLRQWVLVTGAGLADSEELDRLAADARLGYRAWAEAWTSGQAAQVQDEIVARDAAAELVREYQPSLVPGLLQIPGYTRAALATAPAALGVDAEQVADMAAARARRQQASLYSGVTRFQFVLGEAALRVRFGSAQLQRSQLDRLAMAAELDNVEVAVLPFSRPSPVLPLSGFVVVDDEIAEVETLTGEQRLTLPEDVAVYTAAFEVLRRVAVSGDLLLDLLRS